MTHLPEHTTSGPGWTATNIDALGAGPGMRKVRAELGVTAFGVNALVFAPNTYNRWHWHDTQEELYVVLEGTLTLDVGEESVRIGTGGLARVDAQVHRRLRNTDGEQLVLLALGGNNGYVERDGNMRADEVVAIGAGEPFAFLPE